MSIAGGKLLLLDTNVLVHLARDDATGQAIEARFSLTARPERPLVSTVVEGEMLGLARYWNWGEKKLAGLRELLAELVRVDAGLNEIVEAYAELYAEGQSKGEPCGENDLWIAATAKATGATLLTCDTDFDWLDGIHITRHLIAPSG